MLCLCGEWVIPLVQWRCEWWPLLHRGTVQRGTAPCNPRIQLFYINLSQLCALVSPSVHSELFNLLKAFLFPPIFEKSCWTPFVNNGNLRRLKVWELCTYGDLLVNPEDCSPLVVSQTPFASSRLLALENHSSVREHIQGPWKGLRRN